MSAGGPLAAHLNAALGTQAASSAPETLAAAAVGGAAPRAVAFPADEAQAAAVLALAHAEGWGVVPWGSGQARAGGAPPTRYDVALVTTGLGAILDHDSENLTLTAQAGATLAEVNRQVRARHQVLPLGFAHERRTLGGLVAANRAPPQRLTQGDLRDQLLGVRVATADGKLVRYGRKVLKNVAGYDMNKLFVGSEGLLGVIVEVTFKLAALPDETACLLGGFPDARGAFACAGALFRGPLQPSGLYVLDAVSGAWLRQGQGVPAHEAAAHLLIGFEGRGVTVKRQLNDGRELLAAHGAGSADAFDALTASAAAVLEAPGGQPPASGVALRLGMAATDLPALWDRAEAALGTPAARVADYGSGRLLLSLDAPRDGAGFAARVATLRGDLAARRGYAVLERAPAALRAQVPAWGDLGGELALLRSLKAQLDPKGILSPGRFFP